MAEFFIKQKTKSPADPEGPAGLMLIMSLSHNSDIYVKIVEKQIVVLFYQIVFFKTN